MKLNWIEKMVVNSLPRAVFQRQATGRRLRRMGGCVEGAAALEVGCGRGVGIGIILDLFGADRVDAVDLDPDMVRLARRRFRDGQGRVRLWVGSAAALPVRDGVYDAVFDFGIIHHVGAWREALREIHRVLRPGGRLYVEEIQRRFIVHPFWRRIFRHPQNDRFDHRQLIQALSACGFEIIADAALLDVFSWVAAVKPLPSSRGEMPGGRPGAPP
jgi:ubiquinone/menaquinone biosynthesis C-methylase UbiE